MKKSIKYSSVIAAALLSVAPIVTNSVATVSADSTTQVAKKGQPGDSEDNPIMITYSVGLPESTLKAEKEYYAKNPYGHFDLGISAYAISAYKGGTNLRIPYFIYVNGKLLRGKTDEYVVDPKTGVYLDKNGNEIKDKYGRPICIYYQLDNEEYTKKLGFKEDEAQNIKDTLKKYKVVKRVDAARMVGNTGSRGVYPTWNLIPGKIASAPLISIPFKLSPNTWYKFDDADKNSTTPIKTNENGYFDNHKFLDPGFTYRVPEKNKAGNMVLAEYEVKTPYSKGYNPNKVKIPSIAKAPKKGESGYSKENPIKLSASFDVANIKAGDHIYNDHEDKNEKRIDKQDEATFFYGNGHLLPKVAGYDRYNHADGGEDLSTDYDFTSETDPIFHDGKTYTFSGANLSQLNPNTWYEWTDIHNKNHIQETDSDGYLFKHDYMGNHQFPAGYKDEYSIKTPSVTFIVGKDSSKVVKDSQSSAKTTDKSDSAKVDVPKSDSTDKTEKTNTTNKTEKTNSNVTNSSTTTSSTNTTAPSTDTSTNQSSNTTADMTNTSSMSSTSDKTTTAENKDSNVTSSASNSQTKVVPTKKSSKTKRILTHAAFVYNKKGKAIKKHAKRVLLKKGTKVNTWGKPVTIKGKKYYKIGKNKYVKVANFKVKFKPVKATVKGKKNSKVRTYTSKGKATGKYVYGKKRYKFNKKKNIKNKTYYKLSGKNQWVLSSKLILKK